MKSIRLLDRRAAYSLSSLGLLLGIVAPAALPAFVSADVLTSRSITMSSAIPSATSVSYELKVTTTTAIAAAGGMFIEFCSDSPLIGAACTHPSMSVASVSSGANGTASDFDSSGDHATIEWIAGGSGATAGAQDITFTGITNPSATGTFYARITTYAGAPDYASATSLGTVADSGSVALSTNDQFGVTAYVMESMTFCVSKGDIGHIGALTDVSTTTAPTEDCGATATGGCGTYHTGCVVDPTMTLGQKVGGSGSVLALDTSNVSTGSVYAQLSTNASGGASVRLKSDALSCGGLYLNGLNDGSHCGIPPQTSAGMDAGTAGFGLTVGSAALALTGAGGAGTGSGTGFISAGTGYDSSDAFLDNNGTTGVTGAYGSEIFKASQPVDNVNVPVTFNATVSNTTAAGSYGANLDMIATGTF